MERKQRLMPEEALDKLRRGWVRYGELKDICMRHWGIGPTRVAEHLAPKLLVLHAKRVALHPYVWYTLCETDSPVETELMRARAEWLTIPASWRKNHPIGQIADPRDFAHAMLLGALAYQGDEAAMNAFMRMRRKSAGYLIVRGRANPLDMFLFGERRCEELEDAEQ